jgi:transposase
VTERELDRRVARRLAMFRYHEEGHSVAQTCRRYGVARETYYEWQRRYRALGLEGLRDRSTRPHHCPFAISEEAIDKIVYLRQNYHFGPYKLSMYLKRYHQLEISVSGVWRVLRRRNLNRLPSSQRYKRHKERWRLYEKPQPGQCL